MARLLDFYKGMDLSFLQQCVQGGMITRNFDGTPVPPLLLAKQNGVNAIRLRLWHTPENVPESGGWCNLSHTLEVAKEIKAHGFDFLLDFHYSDYWADPAQQNKPKAWVHLHGEALEQAVYEYTRDSLLAFKNVGAMPDMVQIGNEIRSGMLFPDGATPNYATLARLVNAGLRGAREAGGSDLTLMLHLDQGGRYQFLHEWFDRMIENGLDAFDIIGLSYYAFWHGTFTDLKNTMEKIIRDYKKPIILAETAYAWRTTERGFIDQTQERIAGFPATPCGQRKVLELVMQISASLPNHMGRGLFYWEPFCVPRSEQDGWAENMGLLSENGTVLEGLCAFSFTRECARAPYIVRVYQPQEQRITPGGTPVLPKEVKVLLSNGTLESRRVDWEPTFENNWKEQVGNCFTFTGHAESVEEPILATVSVRGVEKSTENLLCDTNWDDGLARWQVEKSGRFVSVELRSEFVDPFPAPPVNSMWVEADRNFHFSISQLATNCPAGVYQLEVEYCGADTTGVDVRLFLIDVVSGKQAETAIHPTEHEWQRVQTILCLDACGTLEAGLRMTSPPVYGSFRHLSLHVLNEKVGDIIQQLPLPGETI